MSPALASRARTRAALPCQSTVHAKKSARLGRRRLTRTNSEKKMRRPRLRVEVADVRVAMVSWISGNRIWGTLWSVACLGLPDQGNTEEGGLLSPVAVRSSCRSCQATSESSPNRMLSTASGLYSVDMACKFVVGCERSGRR